MKKALFLVVGIAASILLKSQTTVTPVGAAFPTQQSSGSPTTEHTFGGVWYPKVGLINSRYSDTTVANQNLYLKNYPGAQIMTHDTVWVRSFPTANRWLIATVLGTTTPGLQQLNSVASSGTHTLQLNPLGGSLQYTAGVGIKFTSTTGLNGSLAIEATGEGKACSPSIQKINSTQVIVCSCPDNVCDTVTASGNINNYYFNSDSTIVVVYAPTFVCDTVHADPPLIDSVICTSTHTKDTFYIGGTTDVWMFQNGLKQFSPKVIEQGGVFNRHTNISGSNQYNFTYDSLNFFVRGPFGSGQPITSSSQSQMFFTPRKAAFRVGQESHGYWVEDSIGAYSIAMGANVNASGPYGISIGGTSNYNYVNLGISIGGTGNRIAGARGMVLSGETNYIPLNSYMASAIGSRNGYPAAHFSTVFGEDIQVYSRDGVGLGSYNDTTDSGATTSTINNTRRLFQVGDGTGIGVLRSNAFTVYTDKVSIGGVARTTAAQLILEANNMAFAVNKGNTAQMNSIASPYDGLLYWNSDSLALCEYVTALSGWQKVDRSGGSGGGGGGSVTSVIAGNGMDFSTIIATGTVHMGTPSSVTLTSTNTASGTTHTHAFSPGGTSSQVVLGNGTLGTLNLGGYNSNIGSGYRWAVPNTNNIKTFFAGSNITIDSVSNTNGLTIGVSGLALSSRSIGTGYGLTGGGDLSINRTHVFDSATVFPHLLNTILLTNNGTTGASTWDPVSRILNIPIYTGGGGGSVVAVSAGNGMNFTTITGSGPVTLGTPSSITLTSTNSVTTNSHTHAFNPGGTSSQVILGNGTLGTLPTGTVTSVAAGGGMNFSTFTTSGSVVMGTPSNITLSSINSVSGTTHTHAFVPGGTSSQVVLGNGTLGTYTSNPVVSVTGTTNRITVTGTTTAIVDIAATYVGQTSITTLGTITTGTWSSGAIIGDATVNVAGTDATGDTWYRNASGVFTRLGIGATGKVLKVSAGGIPEWGDDNTGGGGSTSPGGSNQNVQFNNAGAFGGIATVNYDGTNLIANSGVLVATRPKFITSIDDTNGNEFFKVTATPTAVNEITVANAATGGNPSLTASGGDSGISIDLFAKAGGLSIGAINIKNTNASYAGAIRIYEAPTNGTNSTTIVSASAMPADITYILPNTVPSTNGHILGYDITGQLQWVDPGGTPGISVPINHIVNATGIGSSLHGDYNQVWDWDGLTNGVGFHITSTSSANTDDNFAFAASSQGTNSVSGVASYAAFFSVSKVGPSSKNVGLGIDVISGTYNYALITFRGKTGINNDNPTAPLTLGSGPLGTEINSTPINAQMDWYGSTSGVVTIKTAANAGTYTLTLPTSDGNGGEALFVNSSGELYWDVVNGGGITSLGPIGSSPNANAATITGSVLNLEPADGTYGGVITTSAQTMGDGIKTFQKDIVVNGIKIGLSGGQVATNISMGGNALLFNSSGASNMAFGNGAMFFNTSGNDCSAFGYEALYHNTTGSNCIAVGADALRENTTAGNNVGVGVGALQNNKTGIENTAMGNGALAGAGTYSFANSAFGFNSLASIQNSAEQNAAFGKNTLMSLTTGIKNSAFGAAAMENATTAYQCTIIGMDAGLHITSGWGNNAVGWLAGGLNETGYGNDTYGWQSGRNIKNGNENIALGFSSMYLDLSGNNSQTQGVSNSIAIGAYTYTTASNQIVIGNANHTATYLRGTMYFNNDPGSAGQVLTSQGPSAAPTWTSVGTGTVTTVIAGAGMDFVTITGSGSVIMGTPSSVTLTSTNNATSTTHTHAFAPGGTSSQIILGNGTLGARGITDITATDGNGFDFNLTGTSVKDIALTTTVANTQVMFSNSGAVTGASNFTFTGQALQLSTTNTTQATSSAGFYFSGNSITTGTGIYAASTSITTGKLMHLSINTTAAGNDQSVLYLATTGANSSSSITTVGLEALNTHSGTGSINIGIRTTATGGDYNVGFDASFSAAGSEAYGVRSRITGTSGIAYAGYFTTVTDQPETTSIALYASADGDGDNFALITNQGTVGINTPSPSEQFEVTGRTRFNGQYYSLLYFDTDASTITFDFDNGNVHRVTLGGNRTIAFSNPKVGAIYTIELVQDGTGSRTVTWPGGLIKWKGGSAPTLTTTPNKTDIIHLFSDGTGYYGYADLNF